MSCLLLFITITEQDFDLISIFVVHLYSFGPEGVLYYFEICVKVLHHSFIYVLPCYNLDVMLLGSFNNENEIYMMLGCYNLLQLCSFEFMWRVVIRISRIKDNVCVFN